MLLKYAESVRRENMRLGVSPPGLSVGALHGLTRFSVCSIRAFSFFSRGFERGLHGLLFKVFWREWDCTSDVHF
jgi:hypothetical protein